jgi:hypothetical protein
LEAEAGTAQRLDRAEGLVDVPEFQDGNIGAVSAPAAPNVGFLRFGHVRHSFVMNRFIVNLLTR